MKLKLCPVRKLILNLAVASGMVSSFVFTPAFARHEDSAGVYKADAYRERIAKSIEAVVESSNYVQNGAAPSQQLSPTLKGLPQKIQSAQVSNSGAAVVPVNAQSLTDKMFFQVKNFFFGGQAPGSIRPGAVGIGVQAGQPAGQKLVQETNLNKRAPSSAGEAASEKGQISRPDALKNLSINKLGVEIYQISTSKVPYLEITKEAKITAQLYALSESAQKKFVNYAIAPLLTPEIVAAKSLHELMKLLPVSQIAQIAKINEAQILRVSHADLERLKWMSVPEPVIKLVKYVPLTIEENRLLNGILLYRQGDKCAVAVSLFYPLTKTPFYESEGNYFLSLCSKQLGLMTDFYEKARRVFDAEDLHYSKKLFKELSEDVPPEVIDTLGKSLFKLSANKKAFEGVDPLVKGNVYFILTNFGAKTERFKTTLSFSQLVPEKHAKYLEAQFLRALAEYEIGDKAKALKIQEDLIHTLGLNKKNDEFQALVALNLARMQFQEKKFKEARENFLKVSKDHPLWVQSLTEMGWAQLEMADFGGAIGNMYSVQSPFFNSVFKPESYVIRTIGYLKLCQYGDAYKTLSILEKLYRPALDKISAYQSAAGHAVYQTVRSYISSKASGDVDGLPGTVIREMARHKDFLIRQLALNRQAEERDIYSRLDRDVETSLARAQATITKSRLRIESLKKQIVLIGSNATQTEVKRELDSDLEHEFRELNSQFFQIDLFNDAKKAVSAYRAESVKLAEQRIAATKIELESTLKRRLANMKEDLTRILENNELLRYEVYSGSGENIRFQVAGGEKSNRVPASILPKSKSLQWDFDGEYWEDEIGHYRSSLKNNCADSRQARNGGSQ